MSRTPSETNKISVTAILAFILLLPIWWNLRELVVQSRAVPVQDCSKGLVPQHSAVWSSGQEIIELDVSLSGEGVNAVPVVRQVNTYWAQVPGEGVKEKQTKRDFLLVNGGVISAVKRPADFYTKNAIGNEWMQVNYEPSVGCAGEIRVGDAGDGGKWICPALIKKNECTILSIGLGGLLPGDTSFERVMHEDYGCEVHGFDHTKGYVPGVKYFTYHNLGLSFNTNTEQRVTTLRQMAAFFQRPCCSILKVDVEGHEFATFALSEENRDFLNQVVQLSAELHFIQDKPEDMTSLAQQWHDVGMRVFHKEPNIQYTDGSCTEFSYVNAHLLQLDQHLTGWNDP